MNEDRKWKFRELLAARQMTHTEFAATVGLSQGHLSNVIRGAYNPPVEVKKRINAKLGVILFPEADDAKIDQGV